MYVSATDEGSSGPKTSQEPIFSYRSQSQAQGTAIAQNTTDCTFPLSHPASALSGAEYEHVCLAPTTQTCDFAGSTTYDHLDSV